jgi:UPF0755 protein
MKRFVLTLLLGGLLAVGIAVWLFWRFAHTPLPLPKLDTPFEFTVERGATLKSVSKKLTAAGLLPEPNGFFWLGRITDQATGIQAGAYRLDAPITPLALLKKMNDGDVITMGITFVEGINFRDMREQIEANTNLKVTLKGLPASEVLKRIGATETHPEGLFFPDTYRFSAGTTDLDLWRISYQAMQKRLAEAWEKRQPNLPYKNAYEVLIMASIIEKETGRADERPLIGSVFVNRLRIPMRLQTDPTVIYGIGERYDGNIRRRDLTTDTAYNTYTRDGLPPTPIAMPGAGSINAAVQPVESDKLYFVATRNGDGSHYFSRSLDEHNRAVAKYQLGR